MRRIETIIIAGIFIPAAITAVALENYAQRELIPQWCASNPVCATSRAATAEDPIWIP